MALLSPIVVLPLLGFVLNGLIALSGRRDPVALRAVTLIGCVLPLLAFGFAVRALWALEAHPEAALIEPLFTWAVIGEHHFAIDLYLDRLSALMALIVTGIGSLIHLYSSGYMKGDAGYARYFAYLNLFLFFMLLLVLGHSLLVVFVGWEGVGLVSYLLIGFWFKDTLNAKAGKKAFIVNRIGDAGFLLGIFALFSLVGSLQLDIIQQHFLHEDIPVITATVIGLLLFIGAMGKSAQLPLHVWLADAMAGPTPVSALIHAATMVTAGVYLVARLSGVYEAAPLALAIIASIGVATALFAATVALVQTDIKKVLAYSTVSQLGFMFIALGVGAYGVAIFHLFTHAFFKACLFLAAGSVIHALQGEQDIRKMGGLARALPLTFIAFAIATAAIAGLPPLAGFFSKDEILWFALSSSQGGHGVLWGLAALSAFLTAFYMFRLLWLVFLGQPRTEPALRAQLHEAPWNMNIPVLLLAAGSLVAGFWAVPGYLHTLLPAPAIMPALAGWHGGVAGLAIALALAGLGLAVWRYGGSRYQPAPAGAPMAFGLQNLLTNAYYVDALYQRTLRTPLQFIAQHLLWRWSDQRLLDGSLHLAAATARLTARLLAYLHNGQVQWYLWLALLGLVLAVLLS
ncbi:NADH-quinone oxidoreductase subunit L [Thiorhodospira sibirica]|uniref:NADH-quinone oxidoreductase subunit L n=1 Tax=Thiorhodospira sibirica TaxID=154347 RepID=UPI00022C2DDC|nr:NADH-quinone oxidoreductase subunit L [Thiorhodospira sibirica]